jgi:hypothetical protein
MKRVAADKAARDKAEADRAAMQNTKNLVQQSPAVGELKAAGEGLRPAEIAECRPLLLETDVSRKRAAAPTMSESTVDPKRRRVEPFANILAEWNAIKTNEALTVGNGIAINAPVRISTPKVVNTFEDWKKLSPQDRNGRLKSCMMRTWLEGKKCVDCGESDTRCIDNDHVNPKTKSRRKYVDNRKVGQLAQNSVRDLPGELAKTVPRCRNCHRRRHASESLGAHDGPAVRKLRAYEQAEKKKRGEKGGCIDCHLWDPTCLRMFDWDHTNPKEKVLAVSHLILNPATTIKQVAAELAKCELRCACCHRKRTAIQCGHKQLSDFLPNERERARIELFGTKEQKEKIRPRKSAAERPRRRAVRQLDANTGKVIAEYKSVSDAACALKANVSSIHRAACEKFRVYCGYKWRFVASLRASKSTNSAQRDCGINR